MRYQLTIDDFIGNWGYSKGYVRNVLSQYQGKHVDVKISSLGGDLNHALDIRQQFIDHGDVTVYLSGFVASAATVIAMGAKRVVIGKYAMFLVHKCSNFIDAWGTYNADQMQQLIDELTANKKENDKIDVVLANMYADRCGKKVSEILDILKRAEWMTAQETLDLGLVDEIADVQGDVKLNFAQCFDKLNAFGITTAGLPTVKQTVEIEAQSQTNNHEMKTFKFNTVAKFLELDAVTPDADGYVSVTAEQFEQINNRIEQLESSEAEKDAALAEANGKVAELTQQVENLKQLPADDSMDIVDDSATSEETKLDSKSMFNAIKDLL